MILTFFGTYFHFISVIVSELFQFIVKLNYVKQYILDRGGGGYYDLVHYCFPLLLLLVLNTIHI